MAFGLCRAADKSSGLLFVVPGQFYSTSPFVRSPHAGSQNVHTFVNHSSTLSSSIDRRFPINRSYALRGLRHEFRGH